MTRQALGVAMSLGLMAATTSSRAGCGDGPAGDYAGQQQVLTLAEAATLLRLDEQTLVVAAKQGEVPGRRVAGQWRFSRAALLIWLAGTDRPANCPELIALPIEEADAVRGMGAPEGSTVTAVPENRSTEQFGERPETETAQEVSLRRQGILLKRRQASVELDLAHSRQDSDVLAFARPFPTAPAVAVLADRKREVTTVGLTGRTGVADGLELVAGASYQWDKVEFSPDGLLLLEDTSSKGFGDVALGIRYEALTEGVHWPSLVVSVDGRIPTDGSSAYGLGASLSAIKSLDPTALFGSIGYQHTFNAGSRDLEDIGPEDSFILSTGFAFAMNERLSFGTSINAEFDQQTKFHGFQLESDQTYSLRLFLTTLITGGLSVEPSVSFGLNGTDNLVIFGVSVPYTFSY